MIQTAASVYRLPVALSFLIRYRTPARWRGESSLRYPIRCLHMSINGEDGLATSSLRSRQLLRTSRGDVRGVAFINISCNDILMNVEPLPDHPDLLLSTLAEFRFELRRFLQFSESAALGVGLQPQQHQLLLQVAGAPEEAVVTVAYAAARLGIKHNSAVELVNRSQREGLLIRLIDAGDRRRAILKVTRKGRQVLGRLAGDHARELNQLSPRLVKALKQISIHAHTTVDGRVQ